MPQSYRLNAFLFCAIAILLINCIGGRVFGAEYQWSLPIDAMISSETKDHPRAFLWIPPGCKQVRAIVIGQHNLEEEPVLENPAFRKAMGELGFAEIWISPTMGIHFRFDRGDGEILEKLLKDLGKVSGYTELEFAPLVPIGHSAMASFPWDVAAWKPERVLAAISISGIWPFHKDINPKNPDDINNSPDWGNRNLDGVPCLTTKGEYEVVGNLLSGWYASLKGNSLLEHPLTAFSQVVEPGGGHFEGSDEKINLLILFLRKAAQYRLPAQSPFTGPVSLTPINPNTGWRYDSWRLDQAPTAAAAPAASYQGKEDESYWAFDEEMARAIEAFQSRDRNKSPVLLGYRQSQGLTPPTNDHFMVHLKFEPIGDGLTFKLSGAFWDKVPATADGKGSGWLNMLNEGVRAIKEGDPLDHPKNEDDKITIARLCGPVRQLSSDTFAIRFYRMGINNVKRSNAIDFCLFYPGDEKFKPMVQQAILTFPLTNKNGDPQSITFPDIANVQASPQMPPIQLKAISSANLPVYYYVREGPAEVDDKGNLTFTSIPPRSAYPIHVTVVAWQWGRSIAPLVQTAQPIEKTFSITAP